MAWAPETILTVFFSTGFTEVSSGPTAGGGSSHKPHSSCMEVGHLERVSQPHGLGDKNDHHGH